MVGIKQTEFFNHNQAYWLLGALALLGLMLLGLHQTLLFDVDEGAFTEATREMLESSDWGHTTLNGVDRFDKPIGVYWLQAISASILGVNEFAFRLPSALAAWLSALILARFAWELWGHRAAALLAVISVTSLGHWAMARTATADALLGLFFVLIFVDLCRALFGQDFRKSRRVALWVALGLLVKGPVAILLPLGSLVSLWAIDSNYRIRIQAIFLDMKSWAICFIVAGPWYVYAYLRHGQGFIDGFILKHNIERFTGSMEGHSGSLLYFMVVLPLLWLPWSPMFIRSFFNFKSQWQDPVLKYCWLWFLFVFFFFSFASTKLPHYLLYAGPAVCILMTHASMNASRNFWNLTWVIAVSALSVLLLLPGYLQQHLEVINDTFYRHLLLGSLVTEMKYGVPFIFFLMCVLALFKHLLRISGSSKVSFLTGTSFMAFALFQSAMLSVLVLPWWAMTLQGPVNDLARITFNEKVTIVQWGVHFPSFATYRGQASPRRPPGQGEWALVKISDFQWQRDWAVVEARGPLAVVKPSVKSVGLTCADSVPCKEK